MVFEYNKYVIYYLIDINYGNKKQWNIKRLTKSFTRRI